MNYLKLITVEPSMLLFLVVINYVIDLDTNLLLQKSCRFERSHEPDLGTKCDDEKRGVLFVSDVNVKLGSIVPVINVVFAIFAMPWSDKAGRRRRPMIFIPIVGIILQAFSGCLHSYFWNWTPMAAAVSGAVIASLAGGPMLLVPACLVYICDVCSVENRTVRLGMGGTMNLLSMILGRGGSGFMLRKFGFLYSYLVCSTLAILALIIGLILIKDKSVVVEKKIPLYRMFSDIRHDIVDNVKIIFNKNLATKRTIVLLLMVVNTAIIFTFYGELTVLYQYLRYRFQWNERTFSGYMFYKFFSSAVGILFSSIILSKIFKVHDGLIGILASVFDTLAILGLLFATQSWQIYLIPLIDIFHGTVSTITVSFMSKYYHLNELGRLVAVINLFRLPSALSSSIYNTIYRSTLDTLPSAFCILSIVLDVVILLCFCGAYILSRRIDERGIEPINPDCKILQKEETPESLLS